MSEARHAKDSVPVGWASSTLGDVARWSSGGTPKSGNADFYGGGIPWAVISDLTDRTVFETAQTITHRGLEESSAKIVEPGAVLIAMYGSIGKTGIAGVAMATNQAIACAQGFEDRLDRQFFLRYLQAQREPLIGAARGGTQQNISQTILKAWPIALPTLPEQHRIVEILEEQLSRIDAALESVRFVREKAAQFRRSLLHAAFTRGSAPHGSEWSQTTLGDVSVRVRNGVFVSRPAEVPPGAPILRISAVRPLSLDTSDVRFADPEPPRACEFALEPGDLLFTRYSGTREFVGACAVIPASARGLLYPDKLIRVVIDSTAALPAYVAAYCSSPLARKWLESVMKTTAGQTGISGRDLRRLPVPLPPLTDQLVIVGALETHLSRIEASLAAADTVEQRAAALRRSLLHAAFTGRLTEQWRQEHAHV